MSSLRPFWFLSEELLTNILRAESAALTQHLANYPDLRNTFDAPDATVQERTACFLLLAYRKVIDIVYETFASRYDQPPPLSGTQSNAIKSTYTFVAADAPPWILEMNEVAELLPARIQEALPEPLRTAAHGYDHDNPAQVEAVTSAKKTLSSVEQIQALTGGVIDQQLRRLESRWSIVQSRERIVHIRETQTLEPKKRQGRRKRDKQRMAREKEIAEIADISETNIEFLQIMDERRIKPQPTWSAWPGSWVQAYKIQRLRKLIHQDKSRAIARTRIPKK